MHHSKEPIQNGTSESEYPNHLVRIISNLNVAPTYNSVNSFHILYVYFSDNMI